MDIKRKLDIYIKENYQRNQYIRNNINYSAKSTIDSYNDLCEDTASSDINQYINNNIEETFQEKLFYFIDKKNIKDSDVYNKVNIDRRLFSKIRSNKNYHPSKETVILFAISLELDENELEELLKSASYSLPKNSIYDLIIRFCFKEKIYDLDKINFFLYDYNCNILSN